ncbi:MAG: tyrosine-type recombinase/integrase [Candidatus Acidiferrales bacterium]
MISSFNGLTAIDVRDHAMVLLMAIYGLRAGEIRALRITDADLTNRVLTIAREKTRDVQRFPLTPQVSRAIQKYVNRARPASESPSLFLTTLRTYRPISANGLYARVNDLFRRSGVESRHKGPHALRHACANQLMDEGASVREIGAFLGHRNFASVREYARYNVLHLRQIAEFSLEGLL